MGVEEEEREDAVRMACPPALWRAEPRGVACEPRFTQEEGLQKYSFRDLQLLKITLVV